MAKVTEQDVILTVVPPRMKDRYTLRVKSAEFGPSKSSGNPMLTLECEIIDPLIKVFDNKEYALDQLRVMYYFTTKVINPKDDESEAAMITRSKIAKGRLRELHKRLGLDPDFDDENYDIKVWDNVCFFAIVDSKEKIAQRQDPTTGKYEALVDGDKKPIKQGWEISAQGDDIMRRVENKTNVAF